MLFFISGEIMNLKKKLSMGLGFLFIIIFSLTFFFCYYIEKLSKESGNILKDNYASVTYSKNMFFAWDDMKDSITANIFDVVSNKKQTEYYSKKFNSNKIDFEKNLKDESSNITEINEKEYVESLNKDYSLFLSLYDQLKTGSDKNALYFNDFLPLYQKVKQNIKNINDINTEAIIRKNQIAQHDSSNLIIYMSIIGAICILLAFGYFWYFPFYISNSISYLSIKMKKLLQNLGINLDVKSEDENYIILQSINLIENKFVIKDKENQDS
jgi:hypothetical protein